MWLLKTGLVLFVMSVLVWLITITAVFDKRIKFLQGNFEIKSTYLYIYTQYTRSQIQLVIKNYHFLQILDNAAGGGEGGGGGGDDGGGGGSTGIHRPLYDISITL